jgi:Alkylmercury lyase
VEGSLRRLHEAHALLLHPDGRTPWAVHPFALSPGGCWVEAEGRGWWANCLYCAFGIAAALRTDVIVHTRLGGEGEAVTIEATGGRITPPGLLFHLSTPVRHWWDNVIHACASFQPFRDEAEIDCWCLRHDLPRGAVLTMPSLWAFASDWYGSYLERPWRKRGVADAEALFERHGLTGDFWRL